MRRFQVVYILIFLSIVTYSLVLFIHPIANEDGPWIQSMAFGLLNGEYQTGLIAYDYLKWIPNQHLAVLLFPFYWCFGVTYTSFVMLGIALTIATIIMWLVLGKKNNIEVILLSFVYSITSYTYGFRFETFTIFLISFLPFLFKAKLNNLAKKIIISFWVVLIGLIHPLGIIFSTAIIIEYDIVNNNRVSIKNVLLYLGLGVCAFLTLTNMNFMEYFQFWTGQKADMDGHLSRINFFDLIKFLKYATPIPLFIWFLLVFKSIRQHQYYRFGLLLVTMIFLLFAGRSFYFMYLVLFLVMLSISSPPDSIKNEKNSDRFVLFRKWISPMCCFAFLIYVLPQFVVIIPSIRNNYYKQVIEKMEIEENKWRNQVYVKSDLLVSYADYDNIKLCYSWMSKQRGAKIDLNQGTTFYFRNLMDTITIYNNFNNIEYLNTTILVNPVKTSFQLKDIYKFQLNYAKPLGLYKCTVNG